MLSRYNDASSADVSSLTSRSRSTTARYHPRLMLTALWTAGSPGRWKGPRRWDRSRSAPATGTAPDTKRRSSWACSWRSVTGDFLTDVKRNANRRRMGGRVRLDIRADWNAARPASATPTALTGATARGDAYFDTSGSPTYPDAELLEVQTAADGVARFADRGQLAITSTGCSISGEPTDVLADIVDGGYFLLAIAEPTPPTPATPLDAAGTLAGALAGSSVWRRCRWRHRLRSTSQARWPEG